MFFFFRRVDPLYVISNIFNNPCLCKRPAAFDGSRTVQLYVYEFIILLTCCTHVNVMLAVGPYSEYLALSI